MEEITIIVDIEPQAVFLNMLAENRSLNELVDYGAQVLGNPLMLLNATLDLLALCAQSAIDDEIWNVFISDDYGSKEYPDEKYAMELMHEVMFGDAPLLTEYNKTRVRRVIGKVVASGRAIGYIVCLESYTPFGDDILEKIELVCSAFSVELQRMHSYMLHDSDSFEGMLSDILLGSVEVSLYYKKFLNTLYAEAEGLYYVAAIDLPMGDHSGKQIPYIKMQIEKLSEGVRTARLDDTLAILFVAEETAYTSLLRKLSSILDVYKLRGGLSDPFADVTQIRAYYKQALRAAETGRECTAQSISLYSDVLLYDLIRNIAAGIDMCQYCPAAIDRLRAFDADHRTDYAETLYWYIKLSGNITATAKQMFTHRNTIVQRIEKIKGICGCDINDGEERAKLMLGYKICDMLDMKIKP